MGCAKCQNPFTCGSSCNDYCGGGWRMNVYEVDYFLSRGSESCDQACEDAGRFCDEDKVGGLIQLYRAPLKKASQVLSMALPV